MIELKHVSEVTLTPRTEYALWAGWRPAVSTDGSEFGVVWRGLARPHREAHEVAQAMIAEFRGTHRCNGCRLLNAVFVDTQTLTDDGFDGALFYCSEQCAHEVELEPDL